MAGVWFSEADCLALLGEAKGGEFFQNFGGSEIYIPVRPKKQHPIAQIIGIVGLAALCKNYGGTHLYVSNPTQTVSKKQRIIALLDKGGGTSEIAASVGVTERYVRHIKQSCGNRESRKQ